MFGDREAGKCNGKGELCSGRGQSGEIIIRKYEHQAGGGKRQSQPFSFKQHLIKTLRGPL